jgi:hypothetical protein
VLSHCFLNKHLDLEPDPNYNLFDAPEGFAVFNSATKWFEPTVPFSKEGKPIIPKDLNPSYATKLSAISSSLPKVTCALLM